MPFKDVIDVAPKHLPSSFQPLDVDVKGRHGGLRHGVWDWSWVARTADGRLYVTVAARPLRAGAFHVQVWAGAEKEEKFGNVLVENLPKAREEDPKVHSAILRALEVASKRAQRFPPTRMKRYAPSVRTPIIRADLAKA